MFRYSTDNSLVADRVRLLAGSQRPLKEIATLKIDPHTSSQRFQLVSSIASVQAIVVFIDVDVLVERAIALITIRNSLYSSLNPMLTSDIREVTDDILVDIVSQYPKARLFCLVHDCGLADGQHIERENLDTRWASLYDTHPFHETYFGYKSGCQTGAALACWRDQMMFLYNVSKIFGDIFSRLSERFLSFGRNFKVMCCFPIVGFCVENGVSEVNNNINNYHGLNANVVVVSDGTCVMKFTESALVHTSIMGQINSVYRQISQNRRMIVYETLWNTDSVLHYCLINTDDTIFSNPFLIKQRNYDGSVSCLIDVGSMRRDVLVVAQTLAIWNMASLIVRHKSLGEQDTRLFWIRKIAEYPDQVLLWFHTMGIPITNANIQANITEIQTRHNAANFMSFRTDIYLGQFPFYRYHRNQIDGKHSKQIAGNILLLGPKLWMVSSRVTLEDNCVELVRGTSYAASDVSDWLLTEYAIAHKLILLDKTVINWSSGVRGGLLYMYGSRWLICGRSGGLDPRLIMFESCQMNNALGIDMFRRSRIVAPSDDIFFSVTNIFNGFTIGDTLAQDLLRMNNYNPQNNVPVNEWFNGTLSSSQQVCAYGCKRLKADVGPGLWDVIVKPNLVLFRDAMNAAYMATMRLVVLLDIACRSNGSSLISQNTDARRMQLSRNRPSRLIAQQTTSERAGRRYHTWLLAAIEAASSATLVRLIFEHTIDSLKLAISECREVADILTERFPIIDGVTVRLDSDYRVNIYFDGWSTDAVAIYVASLALSHSSERIDDIDASDIKINIANKLRRVMFFNIAQHVY